MKENMTPNVGDIDNNNVMLDEDDEYIVEYRDGEFVSEEYEPEDVANEIEHQSDDSVMYSEEYTGDENYSDTDMEEIHVGALDDENADETDYDEEDYDGDEDEDDEEDYDAEDDAEEDEEEYYDEDDEEDYDESFDTSFGEIDNSYDEDAMYGMSTGYDEGENIGFAAWLKNILSSLTVFDAVLGGTAIIIAVAVFVIIGMFFQTKNTNTQIEAIAPLGEELSNMGIVGSEGLLAMSSAAYSGTFGDVDTEEDEISTIDVSSESVTTKVSVNFSSVEKDLKIRFTDASSGELITGTAFEVTLTDSKGKQTILTDSDMDGVIYVESITAGTYDAVVTSTEQYKFPTTAQQVTVKDKVQYVVINNIQDEVKTEKQVNVAIEDTQNNDAEKEEETLKDTVEWVDESKTAVSGSENYLLVDKSTIADPSQTSRLAYRMLFDGLNVSFKDHASTVAAGSSLKLETSSSYSDKTDGDKEYKYTIEWSSSDTSVATVDSSGNVSGIKGGTATITCLVTETITEKESSSSEETSTAESATEADTPTGASEESSETEGATISGAVTQNTGKATCEIKVTTSIKSTSLELTKSADSCAVGATLTVSPKKVTRTYSDNTTETIESNFPTIKWTSADTSIATVTGDGVVTGVKVGKVKIKGTIEGEGGTSTETEVEITQALDLTLTLDRTSDVYLAVGGSTTLVATVTNYKSDKGVTWTTSDKKVATVDENGTVTAVSAGSVTITATTKEKNKSDKYVSATCVITVNSDAMNDHVTKLKDKNGNQIYIKNSNGEYVEAVYADYYTATEFYIQSTAQYTYTGWQTIDGKTYYYDKNGNPVTGEQVINGVTYNFGSDGAIASSVNGKTFGIDVSRHNGTIDWNAVKASGVDFVIIRCGYRGSSTGALIEDQNFKTNIKGATAAGLKVGVYVFSQAINEVEAVKEASLAVSLVKGYNLTYPIFIDTESSGGRADNIDKATRTAVVNAFCQTVAAGGYKPGIYASKTWYEDKLNMSEIGSYKIWVAQYASAITYKSKYDMWQYSSKGKISGINGNVDLNYSYLGY